MVTTAEPGGHEPARPAPASGQVPDRSPWRDLAWVDEAAAEWSEGEHRRWAAVRLTLLAAITFGDLLMIKTTLDRVLRDADVVSWSVGLALALAAMTLMFTAGVETRRAEARRTNTGLDRARIVALVVVWLAMGAGLTFLRWKAADLGGPPVLLEGATAPQDHEAAKEQLMAAVLATVYLATGVLAWLDGQRMTNPLAAALRSTERRIRRLRGEQATSEGRFARLLEHLAIAEDELANVDAARDQALEANRALAERLKRLARVRVATHLGDPADTGVVRHEPLIVPETAGWAQPPAVPAGETEGVGEDDADLVVGEDDADLVVGEDDGGEDDDKGAGEHAPGRLTERRGGPR